jgi:UDP-N-acetyl-D-mannosaminuronic acid dehydrogenase
MRFRNSISIIGGCGHIGFPLGLAFANKGYKVILIDKNLYNIDLINKGVSPYKEDKAEYYLKKSLEKKRIFSTNDFNEISKTQYIIICIGTPVNSNFKPNLKNFFRLIKKLKKKINKKQTLIIRSSIYPGLCEKVSKILNFKNLCYCPERVVQGKMLVEIKNLTQIISGINEASVKKAKLLFKKICKKTIITSILEAELIKLFSNTYRYIHFAIANQFFMICKKNLIDFNKLRKNMIDGYNRNSSLPSQGFTAGPCLLKDTLQLHSFTKNKFDLGFSSMKINEKLPIFLINEIKKEINLKNKTVGLLGLTFKSETDDIRDSLSIKLLNYLKKKKIKTLQSDPYYKNKKNINPKKLINQSDIIIIGAPHKLYKKIYIPKKKILIDIWNIKN